MKREIYGHEIDLPDHGADDGVVTDVVVLARTVRYKDDGRPEEALSVGGTNNTTPMLRAGMLNEFQLMIDSGEVSD